MAETARGIRYPVPGDPEHPALDIGHVAADVEAQFDGIKGDATLATDGTLTLADEIKSALGGHLLIAEATRTSAALGAFSTPATVTLPKVKAGQVLEYFFYGWAKGNVGLPGEGETVYSKIALQIGGTTVRSIEIKKAGFVGFVSSSESLVTPDTESTPTSYANALIPGVVGGASIAPGRFQIAADATNFAVSIIGADPGSGGTVTVKDLYLLARVSG
jgi:hypothetical protein